VIATFCTSEREIIAAVKSQHWTDDLRHHVTNCAHCQETIAMTTMLKNFSTIDTEHPLPMYRIIWLKAQYARKEERLSTLDLVALGGMTLVGIAGLLGLLVWRFPQLFAGVFDSAARTAPGFTNVFSDGAPLAVIIGALVLVWGLTRGSFPAER
jgi:hypothetical protein